jgi:hypothetical protein
MVHIGGGGADKETDDDTVSRCSNCVVGEDNCRTDADRANCMRQVTHVPQKDTRVVVVLVLLLAASVALWTEYLWTWYNSGSLTLYTPAHTLRNVLVDACIQHNRESNESRTS